MILNGELIKHFKTHYTFNMHLHLFSINWWRMQDFPVPALPMTKNLNRKSEKKTIILMKYKQYLGSCWKVKLTRLLSPFLTLAQISLIFLLYTTVLNFCFFCQSHTCLLFIKNYNISLYILPIFTVKPLIRVLTCNIHHVVHVHIITLNSIPVTSCFIQ